MADGKVTIQVEANTKSFDKQIEKVQQELELMEKSYKTGKQMGFKEDEDDLKELEVQIEKARNKLAGLKAQQDKVNSQGFEGANQSLSGIGEKTGGIIRQVGKWALAIFSVRSAYNLVRQASSTLAQYNEQYATNLEYIRYVIAQALAPVLEYVVSLTHSLLEYINVIANAWFGVNLFARASAKSFNQVKKNIGGATASAKELQKTLAGFDEMNILNSSSTGGGGGVGGSAFTTPNFGDAISIYDTIDKIGTNLVKKMENDRNKIIKLFQDGGIPEGIIGAFSIGSNGAIDLVEGIIETVKGSVRIIDGILTLDATKIKEGFIGLGKGLIEIITGLGESIIGIVWLLLETIFEALKWLFDKIVIISKDIWSSVVSAFTNMGNAIANLFVNIWNGISTGLTNAWNSVKNVFNSVGTFFVNIWNSIKSTFVAIGTSIGNAVSNAFRTVVNAVISWAETKLNSIIGTINNITGKLSGLGVNIPKINRVSLPRLASRSFN